MTLSLYTCVCVCVCVCMLCIVVQSLDPSSDRGQVLMRRLQRKEARVGDTCIGFNLVDARGGWSLADIEQRRTALSVTKTALDEEKSLAQARLQTCQGVEAAIDKRLATRLRKLYARLALKLHPDRLRLRNANDRHEAMATFQRVSFANATLQDKELRAM